MRILFRTALLGVLLMAGSVAAQEKMPAGGFAVRRCATDEAIQKRYLTDPAFRAFSS